MSVAFRVPSAMLNAISTAANGMAAQSRRVEEVARSVASMGAGTSSGTSGDAPGGPVRIGALPAGDPTASIVSLIEAEQAYLMNAAVLVTAADMLDTLLEAAD